MPFLIDESPYLKILTCWENFKFRIEISSSKSIKNDRVYHTEKNLLGCAIEELETELDLH
jgi:hypothetical protein